MYIQGNSMQEILNNQRGFSNKDPEDFFYYLIVWGYSLKHGYEALMHVKAFEQISSD